MERLSNIFLIKNIRDNTNEIVTYNAYLMQGESCNICGISTLEQAYNKFNDSNINSIIIIVSDSLGNEAPASYITNKTITKTNIIINSKMADSLGLYMYENIYMRIKKDSILNYMVIPRN